MGQIGTNWENRCVIMSLWKVRKWLFSYPFKLIIHSDKGQPGAVVLLLWGETMKHEIFTKEWWIKAGIRALKTVCQTAIAMIGTSVAMGDVNWIMVGSASALSGILSLLTSIAGLPELEEKKND